MLFGKMTLSGTEGGHGPLAPPPPPDPLLLGYPLSGIGYAAGGTPLAVSRRMTFLLKVRLHKAK